MKASIKALGAVISVVGALLLVADTFGVGMGPVAIGYWITAAGPAVIMIGALLPVTPAEPAVEHDAPAYRPLERYTPPDGEDIPSAPAAVYPTTPLPPALQRILAQEQQAHPDVVSPAPSVSGVPSPETTAIVPRPEAAEPVVPPEPPVADRGSILESGRYTWLAEEPGAPWEEESSVPMNEVMPPPVPVRNPPSGVSTPPAAFRHPPLPIVVPEWARRIEQDPAHLRPPRSEVDRSAPAPMMEDDDWVLDSGIADGEERLTSSGAEREPVDVDVDALVDALMVPPVFGDDPPSAPSEPESTVLSPRGDDEGAAHSGGHPSPWPLAVPEWAIRFESPEPDTQVARLSNRDSGTRSEPPFEKTAADGRPEGPSRKRARGGRARGKRVRAESLVTDGPRSTSETRPAKTRRSRRQPAATEDVPPAFRKPEADPMAGDRRKGAAEFHPVLPATPKSAGGRRLLGPRQRLPSSPERPDAASPGGAPGEA